MDGRMGKGRLDIANPRAHRATPATPATAPLGAARLRPGEKHSGHTDSVARGVELEGERARAADVPRR
eukprot:364637-Chlamydomonas_euryale.AAC.21